jgi:hypothetical protein
VVGLMQTTDDIAATVVKVFQWHAGPSSRSWQRGAGSEGTAGPTGKDNPARRWHGSE